MRGLIIASLAVAHLITATPAKSERNPYWAIVGWYALTICGGRYGVVTPEDGIDRVMNLAKKNFGMEEWQVMNIIKSKDFDRDWEKFAENVGGCRKIADDLKKSGGLK
jgi:hypothetical protein